MTASSLQIARARRLRGQFRKAYDVAVWPISVMAGFPACVCNAGDSVEKVRVSTRSNFFSAAGAVFKRGRGGPHNPLLTQPRQF
jgi:hypothetical protein